MYGCLIGSPNNMCFFLKKVVYSLTCTLLNRVAFSLQKYFGVCKNAYVHLSWFLRKVPIFPSLSAALKAICACEGALICKDSWNSCTSLEKDMAPLILFSRIFPALIFYSFFICFNGRPTWFYAVYNKYHHIIRKPDLPIIKNKKITIIKLVWKYRITLTAISIKYKLHNFLSPFGETVNITEHKTSMPHD